MFASLLILLTLPFTDLSRTRGAQFKPFTKAVFYIFVGNFFLLMVLGAKHVEDPYIIVGQISTALYFLYFLFLIPTSTIVENTLFEIPSEGSLGSADVEEYDASGTNNVTVLPSMPMPGVKCPKCAAKGTET